MKLILIFFFTLIFSTFSYAANPLGQLLPVGSIVHSLLTESQFQAKMGSGWVLFDSRSISGSQLATISGLTSLPDARGLILRGKNNSRSDGKQNPDGDLSLGAYTTDKTGPHSHPQRISYGGSIYYVVNNQGSRTYSAYSYDIVSSTSNTNTLSDSSDALTTGNNSGNETAPRTLTVNIFIRIN